MLRRSLLIGGAALAAGSANSLLARSSFELGTAADKLLLPRVDHLIYLTPDLDRSVDDFERLSGIRATSGGSHPGRGTRNALVALGAACYLEIKGPDPEQPAAQWNASPFVRQGRLPRLIRWATKCDDVDRAVRQAHAAGMPIGGPWRGRRETPDGAALSWTMTDPAVVLGDGLVPLLIDWGATPHPAANAGRGGRLVRLEAEHGEAASIRSMLARLDLPLPVRHGREPRLIATLRCPNGVMTLS